jgi:superfamily I DNA/RNA helicase
LSETTFSFSTDQLNLADQPLNAHIFLEGPAGVGKTTAGVARLLALYQAGIPDQEILLLVPQRTLADPYLEGLKNARQVLSFDPVLRPYTIGGLSQRSLELFWPLVSSQAGFSNPDLAPVFLTLETAQYYMAHLVAPLIDNPTGAALFDSVTIDRNRLYSQLLDNLNKAAVVGFPYPEISERLKAAWVGEPGQLRVYDDLQTCVNLFRQHCLANNMLDFSLQIETFWHYLWPNEFFQQTIQRTFRHVIFDNIEEDVPLAYDLMREWLPQLDSALIIYDWHAGYRRFLGADPQVTHAVKELCPTRLVFTQTKVCSPGITFLTQNLVDYLPKPEFVFDEQIASEFPELDDVPLNQSLPLFYAPHRFYPQMLDWVAEQVHRLVAIEKLPPGEIVILAPYLSDALRFSLSNRLQNIGIPVRSHRPSRALREESAAKCLATLTALAFPEWEIRPTTFDVAYAFMHSIDGLDLVRAQLLAQAVHPKNDEISQLGSFDHLNATLQERITFRIGQRYERLRAWLETVQHAEQEFDHFLSRLFGEILSQPGFGFHLNHDSGRVAANLIESVQKFRWAVGEDLREAGVALGKEYLSMLNQGVMAAQYLGAWRSPEVEAVLIAPAYTFLMSNRAVEAQFWLDVGSLGWSERLEQPLTHAYVLSRSWSLGRIWTDTDELAVEQDALYRLVLGLLRRCRSQIYLGLSELGESGFEQQGPLLKTIQRLLRQIAAEK